MVFSDRQRESAAHISGSMRGQPHRASNVDTGHWRTLNTLKSAATGAVLGALVAGTTGAVAGCFVGGVLGWSVPRGEDLLSAMAGTAKNEAR